MLRVAICDDEKKDLEKIRALTIELLESLHVEYEIEGFSDGNTLLNSMISFNIIMLDIEMDEMNGIEIARAIRVTNRMTKIIFITNSRDYLRTGYTVKAEGYFFKPIDKIEFKYEVTNILKDEIGDNNFIFDKRVAPYKVYLNEILYIEFCDRKTILHKKNKEITTSLTLKEWLSHLEKHHFNQCHKAYIVNLRYIDELHTDIIILSTGKDIILSRKYKTNFKEKYYAYIGERF